MNEKPLNSEAKLLTLTEVVMDLIEKNLISKPKYSKRKALIENQKRLCYAFPGSYIAVTRHLKSIGKSINDPVAYMDRLTYLQNQGELVLTDFSQENHQGKS